MSNQTQLLRLLIVKPSYPQFLTLLIIAFSQCSDAYSPGIKQVSIQNTQFQVNCQTGQDGKQWITILTHKTNTLDFSQFQWIDYAHEGVGSFSGDFVQALDEMHLLSKNKDLELLVELSKAGTSRWALYQKFSIASEPQQYALSVSGYDASSTAGDALGQHDGMKWSSPDRDNDAMANWNCAQSLKTSFWFSSCYGANPLGQHGTSGDMGMVWESVQEKLTVDSITFRVREKLCEDGNGLQCNKCKAGTYLCTSDTGYYTCCLKPITTCQAANHSGKFDIAIGNRTTTVMCDLQTAGGGWAQLLARRDGSVNDFYLYIFDKYASEGIGQAGKDNIVALNYWHSITVSSPQELLIEMTHKSQYYWVLYHTFKIANKSEGFQFTVDEFNPHSTGGRSLDSSNGMKFSTLDVDNDLNEDENCAIIFRRPFWNSKCGFVGPLSKYGSTNPGQGVYWQGVTGCCSSLDTIFFKSRTKRCSQRVDNHCSECETGYELITDPTSVQHICKPVCNSDGCTQCHSINPRVCTGQCNPGYYYVEGSRSCKKCASHCATCSDYDVCLSCSNNGVVFQGNCFSECPSTFYPDQTRNCLKCPQSNCSKCSASQCLQCEKPYFLFSKQCIATCPPGYYGDQKLNQCLPCASQCLTCTGPSSNDCQSCDTSLNYIFKAPSSCVCPSRHFPGPNKVCTECHSRCLVCMGPTEEMCFECLSDYWKRDGKCFKCEDTPGLVTESNGVCRQICGDGIDRGVNECQDGNTIDGDGCSSSCKLEPHYACRSQSELGPFSCWETIPPIMTGASLNSDYILTIVFSEPVLSTIILSQTDFIVTTNGQRDLPFSYTLLQPQGFELFQQMQLKIIPEEDIRAEDDFKISVKLANFTKIKDVNQNQLIPSQILLSMPEYSIAKTVTVSTINSEFAKIFYLCFSPENRPGILSNSLLLLVLSTLGGGVMWNVVFHLQLINFLPLINVPLTEDVLKVFTVFSGTNLDLQAIEGPLSKSTIESNYLQVQSLNERFSAYRFKNSNFIINCCFILVFLNFLVILLPIFYLSSKIFNCFNWQDKINFSRNFLRKAVQYYCFNLVIRMALLCYIQLLFSGLLNLIKVSFSFIQISFGTATETFSSILSIAFVIPLTLLPCLTVSILKRPVSVILSAKFKIKYGVLSQGLEISKDSISSKHYYSWFIVRRILFIFTLILLQFSPRLQILIIVFLSLFTLTFVIRVKPFIRSSTNSLLVLNQLIIIGILLLFVGFSLVDQSNSSFFSAGGWFCIFLPVLGAMINCTISIANNYKKCKRTKVEPITIPEMPCKTKTDLMDDQTPRVPPLQKKSSMNWEIMVNSTPTSNKQIHSFSKFQNEELKFEEEHDPNSETRFYERQQSTRSYASTSALHFRTVHGRKFSSSDVHSKFKKPSAIDLNYASEERYCPSVVSDHVTISRLSSQNLHPDLRESNISLSVPSFYPSPKHSMKEVVDNKRRQFVQSHSFKERKIEVGEFEAALKPKLSSRDIPQNNYARKVASFWDKAKRDNKDSSFKRRKQAFE